MSNYSVAEKLRPSLLDQMNSLTPKKTKGNLTRELETPEYTVSEFESATFKVTNPDFGKLPFNTTFKFNQRGSFTSNANPGPLRSTFGDSIKRGSFPIEGLTHTQPKGFLKLALMNQIPRERTSETV